MNPADERPRWRDWERVMICGSLASLAGLLLHLLGVWAVLGLPHEPVMLVCCWLLGAVAAFASGAAGWVAGIDTLLALIAAAIAFVPVFANHIGGWVRSDRLPAAPVAAVVVLSSDVGADTALDVPGTERLLSGIDLVRSGHASRLITTTAIARIGNAELTTLSDQRRLVHLAGLDSVWTVLGVVGNTHDEAVRTAEALKASSTPMPVIAVVTSPLHTHRACAAFEKLGLRVICVPALERGYDTRHPTTPEERLAAWRSYLYERLGWAEYRYRGWV